MNYFVCVFYCDWFWLLVWWFEVLGFNVFGLFVVSLIVLFTTLDMCGFCCFTCVL